MSLGLLTSHFIQVRTHKPPVPDLGAADFLTPETYTTIIHIVGKKNPQQAFQKSKMVSVLISSREY